MITLRKASERGLSKLDWLNSRHTFSFAEYFDPKENGFSVLRVINDDWIAAGKGFGTHAHRDMEIITYVLQGAVEHRDSLGTRSRIPAGDVQRMTAGTGIEHSEFNPSPTAALHLLQIWICPRRPESSPATSRRLWAIARRGDSAWWRPCGRRWRAQNPSGHRFVYRRSRQWSVAGQRTRKRPKPTFTSRAARSVSTASRSRKATVRRLQMSRA